MLSHCANSECSKPFLRLGQGRLFQAERDYSVKPTAGSRYMRHQSRQIERYWLCDQCSNIWTLAHDQQQGVLLIRLAQPGLDPALTSDQERLQS